MNKLKAALYLCARICWCSRSSLKIDTIQRYFMAQLFRLVILLAFEQHRAIIKIKVMLVVQCMSCKCTLFTYLFFPALTAIFVLHKSSLQQLFGRANEILIHTHGMDGTPDYLMTAMVFCFSIDWLAHRA